MSFEEIINTINQYVWSYPLIGLCLFAGIYFTIATKFLQVRHVGEMLRLLFKGKESERGISSFQALSIAISGRVGTGNIAGVATAIALGGPGAIFWMWVIAFLGATSAYVEATLGQIYKEVKNGEYRGGPAYYIEKGLGMRWYGILFAIATLMACGIFLPGVQSNSIASAVDTAFSIPNYASGGIIVALLGLVIFGGVKRIGQVAQFVVPFMATAYILMAIIIIAMNITRVPDVFMLIINSAFGIDQTFAGIIGMAIAWGVKRGIYSNEAGQGTAPHAAAAAEVSHPAKQGLVQAFSVYIDTLLVCTATAFMILFTNQFNVILDGSDPKNIQYIVEHLPGVEYGPEFTQQAIESQLPGIGKAFVAIALMFFSFTTIMAYYYIAECNVAYMDRSGKHKWAIQALRIVILSATFAGTTMTAAGAWTLGDIGVGLMAWLNIVAILLLRKPALIALKDYQEQKRAGKDPVFDPQRLGIKNAKIWEEMLKK